MKHVRLRHNSISIIQLLSRFASFTCTSTATLSLFLLPTATVASSVATGMAFFFNRGRSRHPSEIVRSIKELLLRLRESPNTVKVSSDITDYYYFSCGESLLTSRLTLGQAGDDLAKHISQLKFIVQGTQGLCTL